ncbi:MAG: hypothetical protein ACSHXF_11080 [Aquaticitalea sp.]
MKNYLLLLLSFILFTCSNSDDNTVVPVQENKVLLLKVDFTTNELEGAKELVFDVSTDDFTITSDYQSPGDFGNIKLIYQQLNEPIFDGSIVWAGTGEMVYPDSFLAPEILNTIENPVAIPSESNFRNVMYNEFAYYPEDIDYTAIWDAIDNLELVSEYRINNPNGSVNVFLYTPSVGIGNPLEWDYFIILKN